eukprot:CAMPEP_0171277516 /NCGR_PEP_ID=MMETSP0790-20130122/64389_1 /TAXON_ID=2925 /ORGANISM="Alexandrium catenella, Strain OF101" /LENGTH=109 /DNA_ID=CAMNT_0011746635 /DNA_START=359 /DNA_END=685 /DNA_ORIENTATION=-
MTMEALAIRLLYTSCLARGRGGRSQVLDPHVGKASLMEVPLELIAVPLRLLDHAAPRHRAAQHSDLEVMALEQPESPLDPAPPRTHVAGGRCGAAEAVRRQRVHRGQVA